MIPREENEPDWSKIAEVGEVQIGRKFRIFKKDYVMVSCDVIISSI